MHPIEAPLELSVPLVGSLHPNGYLLLAMDL